GRTGDAAAAGGRSYLSRASARQRDRQDARGRALAAAERVDAELRGHAVAAVRHRPPDERLTGRSAPQVLNAALLVDDADRDRFTAALARLTGDGRCPGVEVATSGPWIPYSFARWEEGPDGTGRDLPGPDRGTARPAAPGVRAWPPPTRGPPAPRPSPGTCPPRTPRPVCRWWTCWTASWRPGSSSAATWCWRSPTCRWYGSRCTPCWRRSASGCPPPGRTAGRCDGAPRRPPHGRPGPRSCHQRPGRPGAHRRGTAAPAHGAAGRAPLRRGHPEPGSGGPARHRVDAARPAHGRALRPARPDPRRPEPGPGSAGPAPFRRFRVLNARRWATLWPLPRRPVRGPKSGLGCQWGLTLNHPYRV